jgi:uncharacterized 2Fe-2S/4Fe-4S cluster protein (DUF4445 family)
MNVMQNSRADGTKHAPTPVHLHMRAMNSLSRCQHMLLANEPMYTFALQDLEEAQKAIAALMAATAMPATQQGALA